MNKEVKKIENSKYKIVIELNKEEFAPYIDKAFEEDVKKVKIDGFREGKVPRAVFIKKFGEGSLYPTAVDIALNEIYTQILIDEKLNVVAAPNFDFANASFGEEGLKIEGEVAVMPEIELGDYKAVAAKVKKEEVKISQEEIEESIKSTLSNKATFELKEEGKVESGDTIVFDFEGSVDGELFEGGKADNFELEIGSGQFIPGFEEQLIGVQSEESLDVVVTFPKDYHVEDLKGKEAVFKCTIHEIKQQITPELTDELVSELEGYDVKNVEEFKKEVENRLLASKTEELNAAYRREVFKNIIDEVNLVVPQEMIDQETDNTLSNFKNQIKSQGIEFDLYVQMMGTTEEALRSDIDQTSKAKIEEYLIINAVKDAEKFEVSDAEIDERLKELSEMHSLEIDEIIQTLGGKDRISDDIKFDKAFKSIIGE